MSRHRSRLPESSLGVDLECPDDIGQALVPAVSLGKWFPDQLSDVENKAWAFLVRIDR